MSVLRVLYLSDSLFVAGEGLVQDEARDRGGGGLILGTYSTTPLFSSFLGSFLVS